MYVQKLVNELVVGHKKNAWKRVFDQYRYMNLGEGVRDIAPKRITVRTQTGQLKPRKILFELDTDKKNELNGI